jgi:hypothetical protein
MLVIYPINFGVQIHERILIIFSGQKGSTQGSKWHGSYCAALAGAAVSTNTPSAGNVKKR